MYFSEYFEGKSAQGWTFLGRPVEPARIVSFMHTDGPFTTAAALRGPAALCIDLLLDPEYVHELLDYITDASIARMQAWRALLGHPPEIPDWIAADDSVEMLSVDQYREFVLPRHRRLYDTFSPGVPRGIHLCGNAQRLFPIIRDELNVATFDTGFPVDFTRFRKEMGKEVLISGGPRAPLFVEEDPTPLLQETERILRSGILEGGRFILQEGNNLPPRAPLGHCEAFYRHGIELQNG
ncbi:MAG: methylcobalamin:coenzyme M methyltransferase [Candidatus Hydrogenedentes bacterium ADurb.Bin179]|nr:MAG: methylcobalamin:coenzyme M methyltransferase [Candidatus Hydrogenedentes bacterium ADurb.Bin179]